MEISNFFRQDLDEYEREMKHKHDVILKMRINLHSDIKIIVTRIMEQLRDQLYETERHLSAPPENRRETALIRNMVERWTSEIYQRTEIAIVDLVKTAPVSDNQLIREIAHIASIPFSSEILNEMDRIGHIREVHKILTRNLNSLSDELVKAVQIRISQQWFSSQRDFLKIEGELRGNNSHTGIFTPIV